MYRDPIALAKEVIERLKGGGYEKITMLPGNLSLESSRFIEDERGDRARLIEKHGPLCLWDVSEHNDLSRPFSVMPDWVMPAWYTGFSSDLFWNTSSATTMAKMFRHNAQFKGYIGTWDVRKVKDMEMMFRGAGIEDSGIGSWNTKGLSSARSMFEGARGLSRDLTLSRWTFGPKPNLSSMFEGSGIVDCGIGNWDVSQANTLNMLKDAKRFTGFESLKPPKWPTSDNNNKVLQANVPEERRRSFVSAGFGAPTSARMTQEAKIARILDNLARPERGSSSSSAECAIL
jgi:hypothetical protein